jgi:HicB_like antitoxin of bacterial toxin-antitoxin system
MRYAVVIEKAQSNYSAYVPDLPGCVATGVTIEEIQQQIQEAIAWLKSCVNWVLIPMKYNYLELHPNRLYWLEKII